MTHVLSPPKKLVCDTGTTTGWPLLRSQKTVGLLGIAMATSACTYAGPESTWLAGVPPTSSAFSGDAAEALGRLPQVLESIVLAVHANLEPAIEGSEGVKRLRERSGLTWDQFAKIFGVSRRAAHLWASGGRMNSSNEALLIKFSQIVEEALTEGGSDDPDAIRTYLLAPRRGGRSLLDELRGQHAAGVSDVNRPAFDVSELQQG